MKPYGAPAWDTGSLKPRSKSRASKPGGSYTMTPTEIARVRRRLKKKARQAGKAEEKVP
jgi:hypothetical protein